MMIGVRNLSGEMKSGEVWVNELRLKEYNNEGGWAAQGALNVQLSDVGTINATGKIVTDGFGGLEDGVASVRRTTIRLTASRQTSSWASSSPTRPRLLLRFITL